jgi:hypothetical protein
VAQWYANALYTALNKEWDWDSDSIKETLHTATYTPNLDTHAYVSDLTNEVAGTGYSTGGQTVTGCTRTLTAANSWATQWTTLTAYTQDWIVRPTAGNGFVYRVAVAGTTAAGQPTWPTVIGTTVVDGTVTWECVGRRVLVLTGTFPAWAGSTITARYLVISDRTPGSAATQPLIGLVDFGSNVSSTAAAFTYTPSAQGALVIAIP